MESPILVHGKCYGFCRKKFDKTLCSINRLMIIIKDFLTIVYIRTFILHQCFYGKYHKRNKKQEIED